MRIMFWGSMLTSGIANACCEGSTYSGALVCADAPGSTVILTGGATSFFSFACSCVAGIVVTGTVSDANPCEPSAGENIVLGFALDLI